MALSSATPLLPAAQAPPNIVVAKSPSAKPLRSAHSSLYSFTASKAAATSASSKRLGVRFHGHICEVATNLASRLDSLDGGFMHGAKRGCNASKPMSA
jgi:hypothetical protein